MFEDKYEQVCTVSHFDKNMAFFLTPYSTNTFSLHISLDMLTYSLETCKCRAI